VATNSSLAWIDTGHLPRNALPPHAQVLSIRPTDGPAVDGTGTGTGADTRTLPTATRGIEIAYTAASLGMPERVRFQYRLEGVDRDWQSAGNRRQAFYTGLSPGRYRFHLKAANEDGLWGPEAEALVVEIPPQWYQTLGFKAALAVLALALLSAAYLLRVRYLQGRLIEKLRVRTAERERIARELHDTLLQETQGLVLGVQNVATRFPDGDAARTHLETMLDKADQVLAQARDSVQGLREHEALSGGLVAALAAAGASMASETTAFAMEGADVEVHLSEPAQWNVYFATREALTNAFRHAGASRVTLRLSAQAGRLRVEVADDGRGIDAQVLARGARPGHWGLTGMRERLSAVGGEMTLNGGDGGGHGGSGDKVGMGGSGDSGRAGGTVVRFDLPMPGPRSSAGWRGLWARLAARLTLSGKSAAAR
jgi:signal transduction histidine kinase